MSTSIVAKTADFIECRLKELQSNKGPAHLAIREPARWMLVAKHVMNGKGSVVSFRKEHDVTRKMYHSIQNDLKALGDFEALRTEWGREIGSMIDAKSEMEWQMLEKFGKQLDSDDFLIEAKDITAITRSRQADFDIFQKATGGNVQKIEVNHVVSQEEYDDKKKELKDRIAKAKQASVDGEIEIID